MRLSPPPEEVRELVVRNFEEFGVTPLRHVGLEGNHSHRRRPLCRPLVSRRRLPGDVAGRRGHRPVL